MPWMSILINHAVTEEGLDSKLTLHYYARMRFIWNLLPQLTKAGEEVSQPQLQSQPLSRVISVLEAGGESPSLDLSDLSLTRTFTLRNCAKHAITMTSLATEHLALTHPGTSFVHVFPGIVQTGLMRDAGGVARFAVSVLAKTLARPWVVPVEESGERHLFVATSPEYQAVGEKGGGGYLLNWDGTPRGNEKVMAEFREKGTAEVVWKHTMEVFERIRGRGQDGAGQ
ncbi:hypothetical protein P170DRAFT_438549 [Aspergillus steynii IBT 23096]|uniref:NAD(P)-binding protein n=1 Tax=Aspergillus steynii IBT 23096 TaxID=1392250 RepID=A0A2I2G1T9_9EURO|nr:uncharacterized protein P170DRAFT_438549 [Aspergillus steynii IBT 23096]PLB46845.1 hypothetical protein P170DRAFT_438549 [Aspergillus steynii IBT 23096]